MPRPECFKFAMAFLGEPEAKIILAYIEELERSKDEAFICQAKGAQTLQSRLDKCREKLRQRTKERNNLQTKCNVLLYAIGKYALEKGEAWRLHEGLEIMEAYNALVDNK